MDVMGPIVTLILFFVVLVALAVRKEQRDATRILTDELLKLEKRVRAMENGPE